MDASMNIGEAARRSGVPAKTIRYYEETGLLRAPARSAGGYRLYDMPAVHLLQFIRRARSLGFTVDECRSLVSLYLDRHRASADVKQVAEQRIQEIDEKITELKAMRDTLERLVARCHGDDRPDCPILDDLAGSLDREPD